MATILITDPIVFQRLPNGDVKFPRAPATGAEAVRIGILTRLKMCRGEWFLNLLRGMPWLPSLENRAVLERDAILGMPYDPIKVRAALLTEVFDVPGVIEVPMLRMLFDRPSRRLQVYFRAETAWGDTIEDSLALEVPLAA